VLVEAAIVIPLLMLITLGIVEYGSAYQQDAAVAAASRAGARTASALPKTDFGITSTDSGFTVSQAVSSALQSVGSATPTFMYIYEYTGAAFSSCSTHCASYQWDKVNKKFIPLGGSGWQDTGQDACAGDPPDQIAVRVVMTHTAVTHLFGGNKTLTGTTIMRFEPNVTSSCGATTS
jgi:Flp pilus assembly protein TadG